MLAASHCCPRTPKPFLGPLVLSLLRLQMESYPALDVKPALIRAFKKTTLRDGDGDEWVQRPELVSPHTHLTCHCAALASSMPVMQS